MKIAFASNSGQEVDAHFGKATTFYVYSGKEEYNLERTVNLEDSYCQPGAPDGIEHEFKPDRLDVVFDKLSDCDMLYVVKIGDTPRIKLKEKGLTVNQSTGNIENILKLRALSEN